VMPRVALLRFSGPALVSTCLLLAGATHVDGPGVPANQGQYRLVLVQSDPGGALVGVSVRFPVGSALDPSGEEGTAYLLARVLESELNRRLYEGAGEVRIQVHPHEFLVTLLAPPGRWAEQFRELERMLSSSPWAGSDVERIRALHLERLRFESGAPSRAFELERAGLVFGPGSNAARPPTGEIPSVERVPTDGPSRFRESHLDPSQATVAVVGPVSQEEVQRTIAGELRSVSGVSPFTRRGAERTPSQDIQRDTVQADTLQAGREAEGVAPAPGPDRVPSPRTRLRESPPRPLTIPSPATNPPAWTRPERVVADRELTSTWLAVAWPFPEGTPRVLLDFLALAVQESLQPSPPDPGLYGAETTVILVEGKPILVASVIVDPRVTHRWEERSLQTMAQIEEAPPRGAFFELLRRRYRNDVLLGMADAEGRSIWLTRMAASGVPVPDPTDDIWRLTEEVLSLAAAAAGPPRVLLMGPERMFGGNPP